MRGVGSDETGCKERDLRPAPCILFSLADNRQRSFGSGDFLCFEVHTNKGISVVRQNRLDIEAIVAAKLCSESISGITVPAKEKTSGFGSVIKRSRLGASFAQDRVNLQV